jgi:hypothetical protein
MLGASSVGRSSLVAMRAPLALVGLLKDGDSSAKLIAANALGIYSIIKWIEFKHPIDSSNWHYT